MNIRNDFPFFRNNPKITYLDSAATTQKPQVVIDAVSHFYAYDNAPIHRGIYRLAENATEKYEAVREIVANFIGASSSEIVFTSGTTDGINQVAWGWAFHELQAGDEIVLTQLEHHANLVIWQQLQHIKGIQLRFIPVDDQLRLNLTALDTIITERTKLVTFTGSSNIVGNIPDAERKKICARARSVGARILIDAAQMVAHRSINVIEFDVDFLVFSGHKVLGPTGVGVLYVRRNLHEHMHPQRVGGSMVFEVGYERSSWRAFPYSFEAGTMPVAQVIGLGAALAYIKKNNIFDELEKYEAHLCSFLIDALEDIPRIHIVGDKGMLKSSGHLVTFSVEGMHPHDIAAYLDQDGICIRAGHQCAQPIHKKLGLDGSLRASFYGYTTICEVELLAQRLKKLLD